MNEYIRNHLLKTCESRGYDTDDWGIYEMLSDSDNVYEEPAGSYRHWDEYEYTVDIDGVFIGYIDAYATGDMAGEICYEFDSDSICEMCPVEVTMVVYKPKKTDE